jgi:hypothetical protein
MTFSFSADECVFVANFHGTSRNRHSSADDLTMNAQFGSILSGSRSSTYNAEVIAAQLRLARPAKPRRKRKGGRRTENPYYGPSQHLEEAIERAIGQNIDALVTRNHYGCLVLNAARALFIDVDVFVPSDVYNPIEGRELRVQPIRQQVLTDLRTVLQGERDYGFRIYHTAAGFRVLATTHEFEPGTENVERLMKSVGADRDFVELCRHQHNFRARLSPKPWRCGLRRPPNFFPRKSVQAEKRFESWLAEYDRACYSRATCKFIEHVGPESAHDRIRPVIEFHDRTTKATSDCPLA